MKKTKFLFISAQVGVINIITGKETDKNYISFFKINNRLDIFLPNPENPRTLDAHSSRIENITADGMMLAMPMSKGYPIMLRPNKIFIGRMAVAEAAYEFSCVYFDKAMDPLPVWIVSLPGNIERTQQRNFVRYDISIPVTLEMLDQKDGKDIGRIFALKTKDISAGGLKIISKIPFAVNTLVSLSFEIPLHGEITASARVVRIEKPQKDIPIFWIAFQFVEIISKKRDAIVQFIFKKQLEERRKFSELNNK